ncbi:hypothetical protein Cni_G21904 [Canna indica]|uniref:Uncharacterized protein n=1 Tax=Canna indica TaxID=4628 RepID=A0AAQ3KR01_9LILI|nr:hypothetical protein Cni_G21904 [Canna indica]
MEGCGSTMAPTYRSWKTAGTTASPAPGRGQWGVIRRCQQCRGVGEEGLVLRHEHDLRRRNREQLVNRETSAASPPSRRGIGAAAFGY